MKKITLMLFAMLFGMAANAQEFRPVPNSQQPTPLQRSTQQTSNTNPTFTGNGTENSPYLISTPNQLIELSTLVNGGNSFTGVYFALASNIDMSSVSNFIPIGTGYEFSGIFDGYNYIISNLTINNGSTYAGLFGQVGGASTSLKSIIKNVGLENISVASGSYSGGLVGYAYQYVDINSCYSIIGQGGIHGSSDIGGLVGRIGYDYYYNSNYSNNASISNSYSIGGNIVGNSFCGGLIGGIWGGTTITNCFSNNNVNSSYYAGGLIGVTVNNNYYYNDDNANSNYIFNCYATGTVTSSYYYNENYYYIGGFSGYWDNLSSTVSNCYHRENNLSNNTNGRTIPGVTPMPAVDMQTNQFATTLNASQDPLAWSWSSEINDGYPYINIRPRIIGTGTLVDPYIVQNNSNLNTVANRVNGGQQDAFIAFYNDSIINGANNISIGNSSHPFTGKVVFIDGAGNRLENGKVTIDGINNPLFGNTNLATINNISLTGVNINTPSSDNVGALVSIANNTVIDSCFSSGTITGGTNVGGLIGNGNSCSNIINCHSTAVVIGNTYVGGLVGYMDGCSVQKCYATGNVSANNFAGGLLGSNVHGTTLKSYSRGNVIRLAGTGNLFGSLVGTGSGNEVGCSYLNSATTPSDAMSNYRGTASETPENALN